MNRPHFLVKIEIAHFLVKHETAPFFTLLGYTKMGRFHVLQENGVISMFTRKWGELDFYIRYIIIRVLDDLKIVFLDIITQKLVN